MAISHVPQGFHAVTPYLGVRDAAGLILFLENAFGAFEVNKVYRTDGSIMHAAMRIDDSMIELSDARDPWPAMPAAIHLYVIDCDASYLAALSAGARSIQEPQNQSYGERSAAVEDPTGNVWYIATVVEIPATEETLQPMDASARDAVA